MESIHHQEELQSYLQGVNTLNKKRIVWIDLLRIMATWGVIEIHGKFLNYTDEATISNIVLYLMDAIFIICVPVFLMLSGMLSIGKGNTLEKSLKRRIPRVIMIKILSVVLCFSVGLMLCIVHGMNVEYIVNALTWNFGTSFISILLGCYLVTPFLDKIFENKELARYFIILSVIYCFIIPTVNDIEIVNNRMPEIIREAFDWLDKGEVYLPVGAVLLYSCGYYIDGVSKKIDKRKTVVIFLISTILFFLLKYCQSSFVSNTIFSDISKVLFYGRYYGSYVAPAVLLYTFIVIVFFKNVIGEINIGNKLESIIQFIGKRTLLIFLLHGMCITNVERVLLSHIDTSSYGLIKTIVVITICFIICLSVSLFVELIPGVKWIMYGESNICKKNNKG